MRPSDGDRPRPGGSFAHTIAVRPLPDDKAASQQDQCDGGDGDLPLEPHDHSCRRVRGQTGRPCHRRPSPDQRQQRQAPGAPITGAVLVESRPEQRDRALQSSPHGLDRNPLARGDGARREVLEPSQEDRHPVRLVEVEDRVRDTVERFGTRDHVGGIEIDALATCCGLFVASASRAGSDRVDRHEPQRGSQPGAEMCRILRGRPLQNVNPDLLSEVVCVAEHEGVRDPLDPLAVGEQRLGSEGTGGAATGHPHSLSGVEVQAVQIAMAPGLPPASPCAARIGPIGRFGAVGRPPAAL
jgi:hypothetical protein